MVNDGEIHASYNEICKNQWLEMIVHSHYCNKFVDFMANGLSTAMRHPQVTGAFPGRTEHLNGFSWRTGPQMMQCCWNRNEGAKVLGQSWLSEL